MKNKKLFLVICSLVVIALIPNIYRILVQKNLSRCPGQLAFFRKTGSRVNTKTVFHESGE